MRGDLMGTGATDVRFAEHEAGRPIGERTEGSVRLPFTALQRPR